MGGWGDGLLAGLLVGLLARLSHLANKPSSHPALAHPANWWYHYLDNGTLPSLMGEGRCLIAEGRCLIAEGRCLIAEGLPTEANFDGRRSPDRARFASARGPSAIKDFALLLSLPAAGG